MPEQSRPRPVALLWAGGMEALEACGLDAAEVEQALGGMVEVRREGFWGGQLGAQAVQQAAGVLVELSGDPRLGLRLGATVPRGALGVVDYLLRAANTVRDAVEIARRFAVLLFDYLRMELAQEEGVSVLRFTSPPGLELHPLVADYRLARAVCTLRDILSDPDVEPSEVWFPYPRPASARAYEEVFGQHGRLRFERPHAALVLAETLLDRPLPAADALLSGMLQEYARHLLTELPRTDSLSARVQQEVAVVLHQGRPTSARVAKRLGLSGRTLRRRLAGEGTTYGELVDHVRATLAEIYLRDPEATPKSIAERLGFRSDSAYRRAYRRWRACG